VSVYYLKYHRTKKENEKMKIKSKTFLALSVGVLLVFLLGCAAGLYSQKGLTPQQKDLLKPLIKAGISQAEFDTLILLIKTEAPQKQIQDRITQFWNNRYNLLSPEEQATYHNLKDSVEKIGYLTCKNQRERKSFLKKLIKKQKEKLWETEQGRIFYFSFKLVASDEELREYLDLPDSLREEWLFTFWKKKDPDPTTEENEFKIEFDHRVEHSLYFFGVPFGELRPWDDRGDVYILYGEPDETEAAEYIFSRAGAKFKVNPSISIGEDGAVVWHYYKCGSFQFQEYPPGTGIYRQEVYRRFGQDSHGAIATFYKTVMEKVVLARAEFVPDFGSPLDFPWNYWKFWNEGDTYNVRVNLGIPIEKLGFLPDSVDSNSGWLVFQERVVISDGKRKTVACDSIWVKKKISKYLDRKDLLFVDQFSYDSLFPGDYNIAVSVKDSASDRIGIYLDPSVILVPHVHLKAQEKITQLIMADSIWIADSSYIQKNGAKFIRNGLVIRPRPGNVYLLGQAPNFYCELYDLKKDENDTARCKIYYYFFKDVKEGEYTLYQGPFTEEACWPATSRSYLKGKLNPARFPQGEYIIRIDVYDLNDPKAKEDEIRKTVAGFRIS
jgi:GWxTD domain-containing protein